MSSESLYDDTPAPSPYRLLPVALGIVLVGVLLLGGLIWLVGGEGRPGAQAETHSSSENVVRVTSESDIYSAYFHNVAAADAKFAGKTVEFMMRGRIEKSGKGYMLAYDAPPTPFNGQPTGLQCFVLPSSAHRLRENHAAYRVRGTCVGMRPDLVIAVKNCDVISGVD